MSVRHAYRFLGAVLFLGLSLVVSLVSPTPAGADPAAGPGAVSHSTPGAFAAGVVPDGTCRVALTGLGGAGASTGTTGAGGGGGRGGAAAQVGATFAVLPLQSYGGSVGGGGLVAQTGGAGGGGSGGVAPSAHPGAGGGGRTIVVLAGQQVLVAGGGGGGGAAHQPAPAGQGGAAGTGVGPGSTGVGSAGSNGVDNPVATVGGGQGGQAAAGGAGGAHSTSSGVNGTGGDGTTTGAGGDGGADPNFDAGGGGGAGYTGGGGGSSTVGSSVSGAGGGGGSSWIAATAPVAALTTPTAVGGTSGAQTAAGSVAGANGQASLDWLPCLYDLVLTKTASPATVAVSALVTWTITVTNNGPDPMTSGDTIDLTDTLPGSPTTVASVNTAGGSNTNLTRGPVTCTGVTVGSPMPAATNCSRDYAGVPGTPGAPSGGSRGLDPGEALTLTYTQTVPGSAICSTLTNTATVKDRPNQSGTTDLSGNIVTDTVNTPLTVQCNPIVAGDNAGTVPYATGGTAVANVLGNDTLNGVAATTGTVTISAVGALPAGISLDTTDGSVDVAPATAPGTYQFTYRICEIASPSNCTTATVAVTVTSSPIVAGDNAGTVPYATGGTAVANVLGNDTLNGVAATTGTVTISAVGALPTGISLDTTDGSVDVAPATTPGTYAFDYRICETAVPANCDTATVTVTVTASLIVASNDSGSVASAVGGTAIANVLANDTLNGVPATTGTVTISAVGALPTGVTLDPADGSVDVAPGTAPGTKQFTYQICETVVPTNCETAIVTVTVTSADVVSPPQPRQANLSIAKTGPASASPGQTVEFSLVIRNQGPDAAEKVIVTDTLPDGLTLVAGSVMSSGPAGTSCSPGATTITCTVSSLTSGGRIDVSFRATIAAGRTEVVNQTSVVSATSDPDGRDNSASWTVAVAVASPKPKPATPKPAGRTTLRIAKSAIVNGAVRPGRIYSYRIVVANVGRRAALDVVVCDEPSRRLVFVSAAGATYRSGRACWEIDRLGSGARRTLTVRMRLDTTARPGSVRNEAVASARNTLKAGVVRAAAVVRVKGRAAGARAGGVTG